MKMKWLERIQMTKTLIITGKNIKKLDLMKYKTAIILCGGKGTRLGQIGKNFPNLW